MFAGRAVGNARPVSHPLIRRERELWAALAADRQSARAAFQRLLADEVLMLLPGGLLIDDRDEVIASLAAPWSSYALSDERVLELGPRSAVVVYRATAHRDGVPYRALFASTWIRVDGGWRLSVHQQTPI